MWQMMDIIHHQSSGGSATSTPNMLLARLVPLDTIEQNMVSYLVLQEQEMGINYGHEAAQFIYVKRVYNCTVAATFGRDELSMADRTILVKDIVGNAAKRVRKLSPAVKATVCQSNRSVAFSGTRSGKGRCGCRTCNRGRHQYIMQNYE
jgi:hypothetical protein